MTAITFVAAGTVDHADNAAVTPGMPAGWQAGDTLLLVAAIRNAGVGVPAAPAGWSTLVDGTNLAVFARTAVVGDTAPEVTFTGGVSGASCSARIVAFRGANTLSLVGSATAANAAAQDVATPALTATTTRPAVTLWVGWKADDATAITGPGSTGFGSWTTQGDDQSLALRYSLSDTGVAAEIAADTLTITGGGAEVSRGITAVLAQDVTITAVEQDVWPVRMLITATGLLVGEAVTIWRTVAAARTAIRGANGTTAVDATLVAVDAEIPFGVPVTYVVTAGGVDVATDATGSHTLVGGQVAVTDAISGAAAEVAILAWPERDRRRVSTTYVVGARTVVVSGPLGQARSKIQLLTLTAVARTTLEQLLAEATSGVVQIRQPGGYEGIDCYLAVLAVQEERRSQDGTDPRRTWTLDAAEVDPWVSAYTTRGWTLADIDAAYTGLTLADLAGDYPTLLAVAQADWGV